MNSQQQQQTIVTFQEHRTTHYHLRRRGYGRLQPLTDDQVKALRLQGVPIDLPVTAPLSGQPSWPETAVPGSVAEGAEWGS